MIFWANTLALSVLLIGLVVRGLRGHFVGSEPHCKRCQYELTGLHSERCPECGTQINDKAVIYGVRKRRWGCLLLAGLLLPMWAPLQEAFLGVPRIDWYAYYPTFLVLEDTKAGSVVAFKELERRVLNGELSRRQLAAVSELMISEQEQGLDRLWWKVLQSLQKQDCVSPDQWKRLVPSPGRSTFTVRSPIREGDPVVVKVQTPSAQSGAIGGAIGHQPTYMQIGDTELFTRPLGTRCLAYTPVPMDGSAVHEFYFRVEDANLMPGTWPVDYRGMDCAALDVFGEALYTEPMHHTARITVLSARDSDPIHVAEKPELARHLLPSVLVDVSQDQLWRAHYSYQDDEVISVMIELLAPFPANVAFETVIKTHGQEYAPAGGWCGDTTLVSCDPLPSCGAGGSGLWQQRFTLPEFKGEPFYIVLRSTREAASRTVGMFEMWGGELPLGPYQIDQVPPDHEGAYSACDVFGCGESGNTLYVTSTRSPRDDRSASSEAGRITRLLEFFPGDGAAPFTFDARRGRGFTFSETSKGLRIYWATNVGLREIDGRSGGPVGVVYQTIEVPQCKGMTDVVTLEDGTVILSCLDNRCLVKIDLATASVIEEFRCCEDAPTGFDPYAIAVAPSGLILAGTTKISAFDPSTGKCLGVVVEAGVAGATSYDDYMCAPNGNLFVCANPDIGVLEFDGETFEFLRVVVQGGPEGISAPSALAFGGEGTFFLVHSDGADLSEFDGVTGELVNVLQRWKNLDSRMLFIGVRP